jgi:hypothetical protein
VCGYFLSLGCMRESRCTFLCSPRVALKILVYGLAQNTVLHLYGASKSEMLKCGRRSFFCPWLYGCLGPYCWRRTRRRWNWVLAEPGWIEVGMTCILIVSNWRRRLSPQGDCGVDMTCLYMVILTAPVTDRRWIGSVIGLDLVGEVELHVPAGVWCASSAHLRQIHKYLPLQNY